MTPDPSLTELLMLWQGIRQNGKVSKDELRNLGAWLRGHRRSDNEDIQRVRKLFHDIVADKQVSADELAKLDGLKDGDEVVVNKWKRLGTNSNERLKPHRGSTRNSPPKRQQGDARNCPQRIT